MSSRYFRRHKPQLGVLGRLTETIQMTWLNQTSDIPVHVLINEILPKSGDGLRNPEMSSHCGIMIATEANRHQLGRQHTLGTRPFLCLQHKTPLEKIYGAWSLPSYKFLTIGPNSSSANWLGNVSVKAIGKSSRTEHGCSASSWLGMENMRDKALATTFCVPLMC